jgi:hypothetical protein
MKKLVFLLFALVLVTSFASAAALLTSHWGNGTDYLEVNQGDNTQFLIWASSTIDYVEYGAVLLQNGNYVETIVEGSAEGGPYGTSHTGWYNVDTSDLDGVYVLGVYASDGEDGYDAVELTLNVNVDEDSENSAPVINYIPNQNAQCETQFNYQVIAVDEDGDDLDYSDNTNLFNINQNGLISFVPSCNDVGNHYITITVEDGNDGDDAEDFVLTITEEDEENTPPYVPSNPIPVNGATNVQRTNIFMHWNGGDPDGDLVYYDLYLGTNPGNMQLIVSDLTQTSYSLPHTNYDTEYYWQVIADDGEDSTNGPVWSFTTVSDNNFNAVPLIGDISDQEAECGSRFRYRVEAHDSDQGDILIFSDNTDLFNIDPINGLIDFVPNCDDIGSYEIVITVYDNHGAHDNSLFQLEIFEDGGDCDEDHNGGDSGDDEEFGFEEVVNYGNCIDDGDGDLYGFREVTITLFEITTGLTVNSYATEEVCYLGYQPDTFYPYEDSGFGLKLLIALIFLAITIPIAIRFYRKLS